MPVDPSSRGQWSSRLAFILAAAGSAIGLGNIWRFPYVTAENGGGAFVLIYLCVIVALGLPVMLLELSLGRSSQRNPVGAIRAIRPGSPWVLVGFLGVLTGVAILSYYAVVAGWTLGYLVRAVGGRLDPQEFGAFVADPVQQLGYFLVFLLVTVGVVAGGVKGGIERMTRALMPVLFLLMLCLIGYGLTLPQAMEGLKFYLVPDFSHVTGLTVVYAIGQGFFSLSLGMGAMITYGSYISRRENLAASAVYVCLADTGVALLAGLMIFPVLGGVPGSGGPGLVFVVLTDLFNQMPMGQLVGVAFFFLLAIAALTSTVSLLEVAVSYLVDERGLRRGQAVWVTGAAVLAVGVPSALSLGAVGWLSNLFSRGESTIGFLDMMDFLFGNMALTVGALLLCLFGAWVWGAKAALAEVGVGCPGFARWGRVWLFALRFVAPLAILTMVVYLLWTGKSLG